MPPPASAPALRHGPWSIIPVQILDGVGAGILGVVTPGLAARLLNGTGHVNLGLAAAPCVALGILLAGVRRLPRLHHALQPLEDS